MIGQSAARCSLVNPGADPGIFSWGPDPVKKKFHPPFSLHNLKSNKKKFFPTSQNPNPG
jgi:hypothetical protein